MNIIDKITANCRLREILDAIDVDTQEVSCFKFKHLHDLLYPRFAKVYDCIIIYDDPNDITLEEFNNAVNIDGDKTGYEYGCTETRINDFIENQNLKVNSLMCIALLAIEIWSKLLKELDNESDFCFYLHEYEGDVTIRFHKVRPDEKILADDLECYGIEAVGYIII